MKKTTAKNEFLSAYHDNPKLQPPVAIIAWTRNLIILQRCKNPLESEFYIRMLKEQMTAVEKARMAAEEELNTINALPAALLRRVFAGEL